MRCLTKPTFGAPTVGQRRLISAKLWPLRRKAERCGRAGAPGPEAVVLDLVNGLVSIRARCAAPTINSCSQLLQNTPLHPIAEPCPAA
jgi:hypothetical protein